MHFADNLKKLRKNKKLTQRELAQLTGLSVDAIASYELKRRIPNAKALVAFEKLFNVSVTILIGDTFNQ